MAIQLILLSGGSGKRLWPLSNDSRSKQFLKVLRDDCDNPVSMVQRVMAQISSVTADINVTIATCETQKSSIERQIEGEYSLVLEPERRDTAPAIMLSCAYLAYTRGVDPNDTVIVLPIDTFAEQAFYDAISELDRIVQEGDFDLVLLGVEPTYPSEKYGYIIPSISQGNALSVAEFKEKPSTEDARIFIEQGALWNCGVFSFKLSYLLSIIDSYQKCNSFDVLRENYSQLPKKSFDYEVVEKASSIGVVPYGGLWKDLGTWNTLTDEMKDFVSGRATVDDRSCVNVHVINETGLPLVVSGLKNSVVVATQDGILVSAKEQSAFLKPLVDEASASRPMYEKRSWGEYRVLDTGVYPDGCKALTKELVIEAGKQLSYQRHFHRSETWTIVSGEGFVVLDDDVTSVVPGMTLTIEKGVRHSMLAISEIHVIEVQFGNLLEEFDIERYGSYWQ